MEMADGGWRTAPETKGVAGKAYPNESWKYFLREEEYSRIQKM